jgi:hypothetical protein
LLIQSPEKQGFIYIPKPNPTATSSHFSLNPAIFSSILPIFSHFLKKGNLSTTSAVQNSGWASML